MCVCVWGGHILQPSDITNSTIFVYVQLAMGGGGGRSVIM